MNIICYHTVSVNMFVYPLSTLAVKDLFFFQMQSKHISWCLYASRMPLDFTTNFQLFEQKSGFATAGSECLFLTHTSFLVSCCKSVIMKSEIHCRTRYCTPQEMFRD